MFQSFEGMFKCIMGVCRFLAEAPQVFAERVQALLPFLANVQGSSGVPFMLPALLQLVRSDPDEAGGAQGRQAWLAHLSDEKVWDPLHSNYISKHSACKDPPPLHCIAWSMDV